MCGEGVKSAGGYETKHVMDSDMRFNLNYFYCSFFFRVKATAFRVENYLEMFKILRSAAWMIQIIKFVSTLVGSVIFLSNNLIFGWT